MPKFAASRTTRPATAGWHTWGDLRAAVRAVPPALLLGMMVTASLCAFMPDFARALATPASPTPAAVLPADLEPEPSRDRCPGCGVVESIRPLAADRFEFTVRLRDGSLRTSTTSGQASWRVGDRILLMGGEARVLPESSEKRGG